jgi:hypothetical protein
MAGLEQGANANLQAFGQQGFDYITTGTVADQTFIAVTALENCSISVTAEKGDNLSSVAIPKGVTIYGSFSSLTVVSGKVLAYRKAIG